MNLGPAGESPPADVTQQAMPLGSVAGRTHVHEAKNPAETLRRRGCWPMSPRLCVSAGESPPVDVTQRVDAAADAECSENHHFEIRCGWRDKGARSAGYPRRSRMPMATYLRATSALSHRSRRVGAFTRDPCISNRQIPSNIRTVQRPTLRRGRARREPGIKKPLPRGSGGCLTHHLTHS
jgi:hypothetical protein